MLFRPMANMTSFSASDSGNRTLKTNCAQPSSSTTPDTFPPTFVTLGGRFFLLVNLALHVTRPEKLRTFIGQRFKNVNFAAHLSDGNFSLN